MYAGDFAANEPWAGGRKVDSYVIYNDYFTIKRRIYGNN